jgi:hypothetical protein
VEALPVLTDHKQYMAVIEENGDVWRYLVSKGCGLLEVLPLESLHDRPEKQEMLSNLVNFVMATDEFPSLPCEES